MKAEYADERDCHQALNHHHHPSIITATSPASTPTSNPFPPKSAPTPNNTSSMFSKFHQSPPKFQSPPPSQLEPSFHPPQFIHQHQFHLSLDSSHNPHKHPHHNHHQYQQQTSEEADSPTPTPNPSSTTTASAPPSKKNKTTPTTTATTTTTTSTHEDGATIEVVRRPRGRPPGSKNKPKPPVVITREPVDQSPSMSPYILEIPGGSDVIESLTRFTRRRSIGICVLTGSGAVANVTLKEPATGVPAGTVTFHGRFDILSISAVLMCGGGGLMESFGGSSDVNGNGVFTISLAGPQGQIVGGKVVGTLVAAGTVYVIAAGFNNPTYHRLPIGDEEEDRVIYDQVSGGGGRRGGVHQQQQQQHSGSSPGGSGSVGGLNINGGGGEGGAAPPPMGLYSCHLGSDIIWAPTAARPVPSNQPPHHSQSQHQPPYS